MNNDWFSEKAREVLDVTAEGSEDERIALIREALIRAYKQGWGEATETVWKEHALGHSIAHAIETLKAVRAAGGRP